MPIVEHDAVMHTDEGVLDWCRQLSRYGFCIVNSVPVESGMVKTVASRIAPTQQHIYGDVFDVKVCSAVCSAVHSMRRAIHALGAVGTESHQHRLQ